MKLVFTVILALLLSATSQAANQNYLARKTFKMTDLDLTQVANFVNEELKNPQSKVSKKMAPLRKEFEDQLEEDVSSSDFWSVETSGSGSQNGEVYLVPIWQTYKRSSSQVAQIKIRVNIDEANEKEPTVVTIEKFLNLNFD